MSSSDENDGTALVIKMKPGWLYVKITEPKPEPRRIELLLRLAMKQWFSIHPQYVIDKTQAVTEQGTLQGINVWYHEQERPREPVSPEPAQQPSSLAFEVHEQVFKQLPKEHIEAVLDEALKICRPHQEWRGTLVVINPGRIAVVLDKQANRGAVLPIEFVYPALEEPTRKKVQTWLEAPATRRHVVLIDGSWFLARKTEPPKKTTWDSTSQSTNMTYDIGPEPRD